MFQRLWCWLKYALPSNFTSSQQSQQSHAYLLLKHKSKQGIMEPKNSRRLQHSELWLFHDKSEIKVYSAHLKELSSMITLAMYTTPLSSLCSFTQHKSSYSEKRITTLKSPMISCQTSGITKDGKRGKKETWIPKMNLQKEKKNSNTKQSPEIYL